MFQAFHLLPYRSALENVSLAQLYTGAARRSRERAARQTLRRVGLGHRLHAPPTTLSGGERQRVAIARALAAGSVGSGPSLLLCDEPSAPAPATSPASSSSRPPLPAPLAAWPAPASA